MINSVIRVWCGELAQNLVVRVTPGKPQSGVRHWTTGPCISRSWVFRNHVVSSGSSSSSNVVRSTSGCLSLPRPGGLVPSVSEEELQSTTIRNAPSAISTPANAAPLSTPGCHAWRALPMAAVNSRFLGPSEGTPLHGPPRSPGRGVVQGCLHPSRHPAMWPHLG